MKILSRLYFLPAAACSVFPGRVFRGELILEEKLSGSADLQFSVRILTPAGFFFRSVPVRTGCSCADLQADMFMTLVSGIIASCLNSHDEEVKG